MITRSEDYVEYCREMARDLRDVQDLALRGKNKQEVTWRIHERIAEEVVFEAEDELLDIGCGDGTLLRLAQGLGVKKAVGLLATEEEVTVVRRLGFTVEQGLTDRLPLADESASVIVCNSVLLIVPRDRIAASLCEMYRVAKPQARIFIGEIPVAPGPAPEPEFDSAIQTLASLYKRYGFRTWLGMLRRVAYWKITGKPMIIRGGSTISFYARPDEFVAMAQAAGMDLVRYWAHEFPVGRYNYLFRKGDGLKRIDA